MNNRIRAISSAKASNPNSGDAPSPARVPTAVRPTLQPVAASAAEVVTVRTITYRRTLQILILVALALPGCTTMGDRSSSQQDKETDGFFGWHFNAPFDTTEVQTVFVYFKSQSFRRDLEKQLTEAVTKEINLRTPYRVVQDHQKADTILKGVILSGDKNLLVEAPTNLPRQLSGQMTVNVSWTHRIPTDEEKLRLPAQIQESYNFVPELGQTTLMAYGQVTESIAKQVVDMMEKPWFLEEDLQ